METILFNSYLEYEKWLIQNKDKVEAYIKANNIRTKDIIMEPRLYNILCLNQKHYISDIVFCTADDIAQWDMVNDNTVIEIIKIQKNYLREHKNQIIKFVTFVSEEFYSLDDEDTFEIKDMPIIKSNSVVKQNYKNHEIIETKTDISNHMQNDIPLDMIGLSNRTYNALRRAHCNTLNDILVLYPDGFCKIGQLGAKSIKEICEAIERIKENPIIFNTETDLETVILDKECIGEEKNDIQKYTSISNNPIDFDELFESNLLKLKTVDFFRKNDIDLKTINLSTRSKNCLFQNNITCFSQLLMYFPNQIQDIPNLGVLSKNEIHNIVKNIVVPLLPQLSYCIQSTDEWIEERIFDFFKKSHFKGYTFEQIFELFSDTTNEKDVKRIIGALLTAKALQYVDGKIYLVYPSFAHELLLQKDELGDDYELLNLRYLEGQRLAEIGTIKGLTRERVRQKSENAFRKFKNKYTMKTGFEVFDEDYYEYFFVNYLAEKDFLVNYFNISETTYNYLKANYKVGSSELINAFSDSNLDLVIKFKIQDYLNRNKILIDGVLIEKNRAIIEDFSLSKLCVEEKTYSEFVNDYNHWLEENGIEYDEKIYYTNEIYLTRKNRLSESKYCLWKQGEKIRYYDTSARDYSELLEKLNLESFSNTEISTLKFFNEYPDVMKKYDIRDQYELHNLLKKVVDCSQYNEMSIRRQPMIQFGNFDRNNAVYNAIVELSPVTTERLAHYFYTEYGYDKATSMAGYFQPFNHLYHQGVYSVEFKPIPNTRCEILKENLVNDFYFISEIKDIYGKLFKNADMAEINPRSLKALGLNVFSNYAIKHFQTSETYFKHILTENDVYNISEYHKKYSSIRMYHEVYTDLKQNYDLILFDKNQVVLFERLKKLGITKEDINCFCEDAATYINGEKYFTIHSLRKSGFTSKLYNLGFEDYFYANLLAANPLFIWQHIEGVIVLSLNTGTGDMFVSKKAFYLYALSKYESIEIDDFIDDCKDKYGINISDRYEITGAIVGTDFYYDSIMGKIYKNKNYYYSELEE